MRTLMKKQTVFTLVLLLAISGILGILYTTQAHEEEASFVTEWREIVAAYRSAHITAVTELSLLEEQGYINTMAQTSIATGLVMGTGAAAVSLIPTVAIGVLPAFGLGYVGGSISGFLGGGIDHWLSLRRTRKKVERLKKGLDSAKDVLDAAIKLDNRLSGRFQRNIIAPYDEQIYASFNQKKSEFYQMVSDHYTEEMNEAMEEVRMRAEYEAAVAAQQAADAASAEWDASTQPNNNDEETDLTPSCSDCTDGNSNCPNASAHYLDGF